MSRGDCGIVCAMKPLLRFLCFASLIAVILLGGSANQGGVSADIEASKPPTPVDLPASTAPENRHKSEPSGNKSSGTIMITMTGIVGDPGDVSERR